MVDNKKTALRCAGCCPYHRAPVALSPVAELAEHQAMQAGERHHG